MDIIVIAICGVICGCNDWQQIELRPYLEEAFELARPGAVHIIERYRDPVQNLRTQFLRIIRSAGVQPWAKPFQNLRSSRETELADTFPEHVVVSWLGNNQRTARRHYLQVTEEHMRRAAKSAAPCCKKRCSLVPPWAARKPRGRKLAGKQRFLRGGA